MKFVLFGIVVVGVIWYFRAQLKAKAEATKKVLQLKAQLMSGGISSAVRRLETAAAKDEASLRAEVDGVVASLKKYLP